MAASFFNVNSPAGLKKLNEYLLSRSYITGYEVSKDDIIMWILIDDMEFQDEISAESSRYQQSFNLSVVSGDTLGSMDQPPVGLAIQGLLRPVDAEEHSIFQKNGSVQNPDAVDRSLIGTQDHEVGNVAGLKQPEADESPDNGTTFYKLEMSKIKLISAHGNQTNVEVEDLKKAEPDAIAHSAAKIISRLKAGGERITQAFKSPCWRCKGIRVEVNR